MSGNWDKVEERISEPTLTVGKRGPRAGAGLATGCAAEAPPLCTAEQSYCVTCHSDKDMLIATADPEEAEVASEESGEG